MNPTSISKQHLRYFPIPNCLVIKVTSYCGDDSRGVPEVAGEDGTGAVENAGERAHECGECGRELKAFEAAWEELEYELRIGSVRAAEVRLANSQAAFANTRHLFCSQRSRIKLLNLFAS